MNRLKKNLHSTKQRRIYHLIFLQILVLVFWGGGGNREAQEFRKSLLVCSQTLLGVYCVFLIKMRRFRKNVLRQQLNRD